MSKLDPEPRRVMVWEWEWGLDMVVLKTIQEVSMVGLGHLANGI